MTAVASPAGDTDTAPAILLEDVRFEWQPGRPVLDVPELRVERGEHVFIQGPSGSGKSTLLGLLGGVLSPGAGRVEVLGVDLARRRGAARDHFRADHIGFIFQLFNLLPYLDVRANVTLPCRFSATRRQRAAAASGSVEHEAERLLAHLGLADPTLVERSVTELSIGQQQRVAAARALIGAPELVIADEPTSALDADARRAFLELLLAESDAAGSTVVFVSHDAALAPMFSRRIELTEINRITIHAR